MYAATIDVQQLLSPVVTGVWHCGHMEPVTCGNRWHCSHMEPVATGGIVVIWNLWAVAVATRLQCDHNTHNTNNSTLVLSTLHTTKKYFHY